MTTTTTVAVYCRISNDPARLEVGVTRQRADCAELVARLWPQARIRVFADNNLSAANPNVERPSGGRCSMTCAAGRWTRSSPTTRAA